MQKRVRIMLHMKYLWTIWLEFGWIHKWIRQGGREEGRGRRKEGRKNESNTEYIEYIVYTENTASNILG